MSDILLTGAPTGATAQPATRPGGFTFSAAGDAQLEPAPIPAAWIVEGAPEAQSALLARSPDGGASVAVWTCTRGAFRWHFWWDETVHIVEGSVTVTDTGGAMHVLRPGDVAFFPAGTTSLWDVPHRVRKIAFCRQPVPRPVTFLLRVWHRMMRMLSDPESR